VQAQARTNIAKESFEKAKLLSNQLAILQLFSMPFDAST
jgi:hypothetical protein